MPTSDLTAILLAGLAPDTADTDIADMVERAVLAGGYGDVWLRVKPLDAIGLTQVELFDAGGIPRIDPALVHALSQGGRRATFVHVNQQAKQAVVHGFANGEQAAGWVGEPPAVDEQLAAPVGRTLAEIVAADDGTRHGIGVASSATLALAGGKRLRVPAGAPTTLGSFVFHDTGLEAGGGDRVVALAVDVEAALGAWRATPGSVLAERVAALGAERVGPLAALQQSAVEALASVGERAPGEVDLRSVAALELVALTEAPVHGLGDTTAYVDERFLPMFTLSTGLPVFDEDGDDDLEDAPSVLAAMVDVLPFASPEGALLAQVADAEVRPLAPWARHGEEYVGSLFLLDGARLFQLLAGTETRALAARVDQFYRAWWKSEHEPAGDETAFVAWRDQLDQRGARDLERFLRTWAEWRLVLAMAHENRLAPALLFYEG